MRMNELVKIKFRKVVKSIENQSSGGKKKVDKIFRSGKQAEVSDSVITSKNNCGFSVSQIERDRKIISTNT